MQRLLFILIIVGGIAILGLTVIASPIPFWQVPIVIACLLGLFLPSISVMINME
jgi:hypothetical protein